MISPFYEKEVKRRFHYPPQDKQLVHYWPKFQDFSACGVSPFVFGTNFTCDTKAEVTCPACKKEIIKINRVSYKVRK